MEVAALGVAWVAAEEVAKGEGEEVAAWEAAKVAAAGEAAKVAVRLEVTEVTVATVVRLVVGAMVEVEMEGERAAGWGGHGPQAAQEA
jgi:hypothetical protein